MTTATAWPDAATLGTHHATARAAAAVWSLPFRGRSWRGPNGSFAGAGIGSSIDFQDHRQYLPGDDPRYIDWQAYARTGNYSMKLYREEVSPRVDLVIDTSASMFAEESKTRRTLELLFFTIESAHRSGSVVHSHNLAAPWPVESILAGHAPPTGPDRPLTAIPFRNASLRVLISDLLHPGSPDPTLHPLAANHGRGLILAPSTERERNPDWTGNLDLRDAETHTTRSQHVSPDLLARYKASYENHFTIWRDQATRHAIALTRIDSESPLIETLSPLEPA